MIEVAQDILSNRPVLAAFVGAEPKRYRRLSPEQKVARARARAARRGGGLSYGGSSPSGRAARDAELERLTRRFLDLDEKIARAEGRPVERGTLPPGRRYCDGLPGSWPDIAFSPQRQREHARLVAAARGNRTGEYR